MSINMAREQSRLGGGEWIEEREGLEVGAGAAGGGGGWEGRGRFT